MDGNPSSIDRGRRGGGFHDRRFVYGEMDRQGHLENLEEAI